VEGRINEQAIKKKKLERMKIVLFYKVSSNHVFALNYFLFELL